MVPKIRILIIILLVTVFITSFSSNLFAQEPAPEPTDEERDLIFDTECQESCGYRVKVDNIKQTFEVSIGKSSKICDNITTSGSTEGAANFADTKCEELCGGNENQGAPDFRQCTSCVKIKEICKVFDDGSTHCWPKPGAKGAKIEYCADKSQKCFDKCKGL